jgi:hypothetical protein
MFMRDNNSITTYSEYYDVEHGDGIYMNDTKMFVYHVLKKQSEDDGPLFLDETTKQYIDVFFAQETINWSKPYKERYKSEKIPAKQCTQDDFGYEPK